MVIMSEASRRAGGGVGMTRTDRARAICRRVALVGVISFLGLTGCRPREQDVKGVTSGAVTSGPVTALAAAAAPRTSELARAKSVAVRPFPVAGNEAATAAMADALAEDVIRELGAVPELDVIARTSAFALRNEKIGAAEIGRRLNVAHLVEGVVETAGGNSRLTIRLVQANSGAVRWSGKFELGGAGLPAVGTQVAAAVAQALGASVDGPARNTSAPLEAYQLYAQGRQAWHLGTADGREKAEEAFNKAIALEPNFAPAHSALAAVWLVRGQTENDQASFSRANPAFLPNIVAQLKKAIELEPNLAEAHALLGDAYAGAWQAGDAERALGTAIRLNRNDASAHRWLAQVWESEGRLEDALAEHRRAVELDPLSAPVATDYAVALVLAGRSAAALEKLDAALALQPENSQARCWRAWTLVDLQRMPQAIEEARRLAKKGGAMEATFAAAVLYRGGQRREADEAFRQIPASVKTSVYYLLAVTGRRDDVIALMAPAIGRPAELSLLMYLPVFDPLRGHPRFREILRDAGAGAAHTRAQAERTKWREARAN